MKGDFFLSNEYSLQNEGTFRLLYTEYIGTPKYVTGLRLSGCAIVAKLSQTNSRPSSLGQFIVDSVPKNCTYVIRP